MSYKIGIIMPNTENGIEVGTQIESELINMGYETDLQYADNEEQQEIWIQGLSDAGNDMLILWALEGSDPREALERASYEKGVIALVTPIENSASVVYYAGVDYYGVGYLQAEYILQNVEDLPHIASYPEVL